MTTKFRIIVGFGVMLVIIVALALFTRSEMHKASENYEEAIRAGTQNTAISDMQSATTDMLRHYNMFLATSDGKWIDTAGKAADTTIEIATQNAGVTRNEARRSFYNSVQQSMTTLKGSISKISISINGLHKFYMDSVRPEYHKMYEQLTFISNAALQINNDAALGIVNGIWRRLASAIGAMGRFNGSLEAQEMESARKTLDAVPDEIAKFNGILRTEEARKVANELSKTTDALLKAINTSITESKNILASRNALTANAEKFFDDLVKQNVIIDNETKDDIVKAHDTIAFVDNGMIWGSVASLVIGFLIASIIIFMLIKTLSKLASYAHDVSEGELDKDCDVKEKGEIGNLVSAISEIPKTLLKLQEGFGILTDNIEHGNITIRGRLQFYKGGFLKIVEGINACIGRLNEIIYEIPSPVIVLDGERKIHYINQAAERVLGTDYMGKVCKQLMNRDDDGTPTDALSIAIREGRPATSETVARPQGKAMDITYTSIPMRDRNGSLAMVLQLVTDLTSIKAQQRTMMEVAKHAGEISDRVAAASEELSSQVEQISRGAEIQRSRVESTASAMSEMNSTVIEVAGNASKASEQSELSRSKASEGAGLVEQVVKAINGVNNVSRRLQENMEELGKQAESIGGVMGVISDIADQTNLLALNAAIEAARAGEAGRGFAVVADEVRKLAEKTMTATQEVGSSIGAIQQSTKANLDAVAGAVRNVDEATALANRSGDALKEIVEMSATNATVVTSIATAAEEQSATSEEIAKALEEINRIVGETTDGMVQSSQAVQDLSRMAQELHSVMGRLRSA